MLRLINIIAILSLILVSPAESQVLRRAKNYEKVEAKVVRTIPLPKWYHEGLFYDGRDIWVCNGKLGKIWVLDTASGSVTREIEPVAGFTEAVARKSDGTYFVTDWDAKKLYRVSIENNKMTPHAEMSFEPSHPAGIVFAGHRLFVITWRRGLGTRFDILEVDDGMKIVEKIRIRDIQEPAHMAWDGHFLWMTSWFYRRVYKIDMNRLEVVGQFDSPVAKTTGLAWDGKYLWLTGTYADLYQLEIAQLKEGDAMKIDVTSGAFKNGGMIPGIYTCDGLRDLRGRRTSTSEVAEVSENISPPLEWSGIPKEAKSIALISDDPDAPAGDWVHWVIFNIPSGTEGLAENIPSVETLENGAMQGTHDGGGIGYGSPCPPSGTHRYYFKVYALDKMLDLRPGTTTKPELLKAMEGHILARGELMGRYKRQ